MGNITCYRLVQTCHTDHFTPRTSLAWGVDTSMSHIYLVSNRPSGTEEEADIVLVFIEGLQLAQTRKKLSPDQSQALETFNTIARRFRGKKPFFHSFFLKRTGCSRYCKACRWSRSSRLLGRIGCVGHKSKAIFDAWKLTIYRNKVITRQRLLTLHFYRTRVQVFSIFVFILLWKLAHVFYPLLPMMLNMVFLYVSPPDMFRLSRPIYLEII